MKISIELSWSSSSFLSFRRNWRPENHAQNLYYFPFYIEEYWKNDRTETKCPASKKWRYSKTCDSFFFVGSSRIGTVSKKIIIQNILMIFFQHSSSPRFSNSPCLTIKNFFMKLKLRKKLITVEWLFLNNIII